MNPLSPLIECIKNAGEAVAKHGHRPVIREECSSGMLTRLMLRELPYAAEYNQISDTGFQAVMASNYSRLFSEYSPCLQEQKHAVDVTVMLFPDDKYALEELLSICTRQLQASHHAVVWGVRSTKAWRLAMNPDFAFEFGENNEYTCLLWLKNWSN